MAGLFYSHQQPLHAHAHAQADTLSRNPHATPGKSAIFHADCTKTRKHTSAARMLEDVCVRMGLLVEVRKFPY